MFPWLIRINFKLNMDHAGIFDAAANGAIQTHSLVPNVSISRQSRNFLYHESKAENKFCETTIIGII